MRNSETQNETILLPDPGGLYDLTLLEEMDDNEYLLEMINAVLDESPKDISAMRAALKDGNTDTLSKKAHKLKSSAGVIQAERLTVLLTDIENMGKTGSLSNELSTLVEDAVFEYSRIERSLKEYIAALK